MTVSGVARRSATAYTVAESEVFHLRRNCRALARYDRQQPLITTTTEAAREAHLRPCVYCARYRGV